MRTPNTAAAHHPNADGFTLVEVLVSLGLVAIIMVASSQLLFSMKKGSDRMRMKSDARQTGRRAMEFLAYYARTAADLNRSAGNPTAIITWYETTSADTPTQGSMNNVGNSNLADIGTDILTLAIPTTGLPVPCRFWPGFQHGANARWDFDLGCPDSSLNLDMFKEMTGYDPATGMSGPIMVVGDDGAYGFYQITNYLENQNRNHSCSDPQSGGEPAIHVVANPGNSDEINPPGGQPNLAQPVTMRVGVRYTAFRVRNGWLEQKQGIFNPATDNPGTMFTQLLPQVEDLQIAWLFNDGTVWNSASQQLPSGTYTNNVPAQGTTLPYDVLNVIGLRLTVTSRSSNSVSWETSARFKRPAAEDHAEATNEDRFYHYTATDLAMIRNRALQR